MTDIKFPDVGEGISEGVLVKWKVKVGDKVAADDILAEVETDKAIVEWPSPEAGTITELKAKEGDTINVGDVVVILDGESKGKSEESSRDEQERPARKETSPPSTPQQTSKEETQETGDEERSQERTTHPEPPQEEEEFKSTGVVGNLEEAAEEEHYKLKQSKQQASRVKALPATRAAAKSLGIDIDSLKGSGKDGVVTMEDVATAARGGTAFAKEESKTSQKQADAQQEKKQPQPMTKLKYNFFGHLDYLPYKGIRKTIGERMVESHTQTAPVTHHDEADITDLMEIRNKEKKTYEKFDVKLTPLAFIAKALCLALDKHPLFNAELKGEDIVLYKYYNIGIAVDTDDGLLVPTLVKVQDKSIQEIAKEIQELAIKARERRLNAAEMKNGTITITNYGSIGGRFATPVINYPQSAILGLGRATERPVVKDGKIYARLIQPFSITFDHRIADGAEAARFANTLKEYLEDPNRILVEDK